MDKSDIIITDSGGVRKKHLSLMAPVLVMRDTTERPEAVDAGTVLLVGTDADEIYKRTIELLNNNYKYRSMSENITLMEMVSQVISFTTLLNQDTLIEFNMSDVVMVGLGYIGLPTAGVMANHNIKVKALM